MINDIYNAVQAIINKNNYGSITPDRFNILAKNAQLKIVSELPDKIRRAKNRKNKNGTADSIAQLTDALNIFTTKNTIHKEAVSVSSSGFSEYFKLPTDLSFLNSVWYKGNIAVTEIDANSGMTIIKNKLINDSLFMSPVYEKIGNTIEIHPSSIGIDFDKGTVNNDVSIRYRRTPKDPKWTYLTINSIAVFNISDSSYSDFELPDSMFYELVLEILLSVGISLREEQIERYVQQEQQEDLQKQNIN